VVDRETAGRLLTKPREDEGMSDSPTTTIEAPEKVPLTSGWWRVLSVQRWFIAVFVASAVLTSLALTYIFSEKYESYTAISYRVQEVTRFKAQQNEAMGSPAPQPPFKVIGQTLQEVLKSDAILRDVVVALRLDEKQPRTQEGPWYKVWYENTKAWVREYSGYAWKLLKYGRIVEDNPTAAAIEELRGNIKVINRDSYIFHLLVRDRYPERAAQIVDYLSKVLAAWLLEFDRQPGRYRAEQLRILLEEKGGDLTERRNEIESLLTYNRVASVQQETEKLTEHLFALKLEESRLASEIARAKSRQSSVDSKLALKQRILDSQGVPAESVEHIPPEDFRKLASERVFDEVELKGLVAKRDALQGSIDEIGSRLRKLPGIQNRLDALKLSLASVEREYTLLKDAYQEAAVRSTSPVSEVRVLHPALIPTNPVTPIKVYHVLLAGSLGLLFALGLVYLLDFLGIELLFASRAGQAHNRQAATAPAGMAPGVKGESRDG
jgi:uncharacterized protein involved in exopolysaccharide biosynthesis